MPVAAVGHRGEPFGDRAPLEQGRCLRLADAAHAVDPFERADVTLDAATPGSVNPLDAGHLAPLGSDGGPDPAGLSLSMVTSACTRPPAALTPSRQRSTR